jgi:LPS sulfotransferase NodH
MNLSEDHSGITKNSILSKKLIENSRRLLKELEVLIKPRESDGRRSKALLLSETTKEPPNQSCSGD